MKVKVGPEVDEDKTPNSPLADKPKINEQSSLFNKKTFSMSNFEPYFGKNNSLYEKITPKTNSKTQINSGNLSSNNAKK